MELPPSLPPSHVSLSCLGSRIHKLSVPKSFPPSSATVTFPINPTPVAKPIVPSSVQPQSKRRSKSIAKPTAKRRSRHRSKQHKYDPSRDEHIKSTLHFLDTLPLSTPYKTNHLLDCLATLPATVEPVSLCSVTVQSTVMPSADVFPWHPDDNDPGPAHQNRECRVKRIQINTSNLTSDLYPDVYKEPIFAPDTIEVPDFDS